MDKGNGGSFHSPSGILPYVSSYNKSLDLRQWLFWKKAEVASVVLVFVKPAGTFYYPILLYEHVLDVRAFDY